MRSSILVCSLVSLLTVTGCVEETGGASAPSALATPPAGADYVSGPYATRGRVLMTTDVRQLGCPQCAPVPRILATPDLDGDGTSEIVLTMESFGTDERAINVPTRMVIVRANGTPYRGISQLPSRVHAREGVVGDFNGDGVDDLFVAAAGMDTNPFPGEQNVLLLSRGAGRHIDASASNLPQLIDFAHGANAGDIDGDGDLDILVVTHQGVSPTDNYFLINDGTGRFSFSAGRNHMPASAARTNRFLTGRLQDVNLDGNVDMLLPGNGDDRQASLLLYGDGQGRFDRTVTLPRSAFGSQTWTTDIDVVDLDRDGLRDLVLLNTSDFGGRYKGLNIQILMNEDGRFIDRSSQRLWGQNWPSQSNFNIAHNLSFVDLNRDGALDFVVQSLNPVWERQPGDMPLQIGLNDGSGSFRPVTPRWLDPSEGFNARQLLPVKIGGRTALVGQSLFGQDTENGFRTFGQRLTMYR
jgi:hypothetical protein